MKKERSDHTLQPTALVNEACVRLLANGESSWEDRQHFLAYAARAMRSVVIDLVRARQAERRGGGVQALTLNTAIADITPQDETQVLRVHEALEELAQLEPRLAQVVEMRYFGGLSVEETAEVMGISPATVKRDWSSARAFLHREIAGYKAANIDD